jgi:hypothetical protein
MFLNLSDPRTADERQPGLTDFRFPGIPKLTFRFSLRGLMVAVTLAAVLLGGAVACRNWRNEPPPGAVAPFSMSECRRALAKGRPVLVLKVYLNHPFGFRYDDLEDWFENEELCATIRKRNGLLLLLEIFDQEEALAFQRQLGRQEQGLDSLTIVFDRSWRHLSIGADDDAETARQALAALR